MKSILAVSAICTLLAACDYEVPLVKNPTLPLDQ
jgi:hypothetical protein